MTTTIKLKRSASQGNVPGTGDLVLGELAVNTYDGKLFLEKNDGTASIVQFDPKGADTETGALTVNGNATVTGSITSGGNTVLTTASSVGTVTSVAAGNGLNFTTITGTGSIVLGTPGSLSASTSNAVTATSHTHAISGFIPLTGSTSITGNLSTTGTQIEAGRGTGSVAITTNDGQGNANLTFNHKSGSPDIAGNAARIEVNVDSTSAARMHLEVRDNSTSGGTLSLNNYGASLSSNTLYIHSDGTANTGALVAGTATLSSLSNQASETTAVVINGSNELGTRELGSNAFTSTTIPTDTNDLTNGAGYITSFTNYYLDGITKSGNTLTFSVNGTTNQQYTFGSNAFNSTAFLTANQTITLSGDVTGSGTTSITTTVVNDSHNHTNFSVGGITNLNSITNTSNTGFRPFTTSFQASNRSGSNYNGGFEVGTGATNYGAQFVFEANAASTAPAYRNKINGTWGAWYRLAQTDSPTFTGTVTAPTLRLTTASDVSLASTAHAFQIGPSSGANIAIDGNEIMARSNGSTSSLYLQLEGGAVVMNASGVFRNSNSLYFHDFASDVPTGGQGYANLRFGGYSTGSDIFVINLDSGANAMVIDVDSKNLLVSNNTSTRFTLNGNTGDFSATGNITAYSSDKRLKENIKPIENALDKVMSLSGVTFDWSDKVDDLGFKPTNKVNDAGVLAQDVKAVLPQAVAPAPFDLEMNYDTNTTFSKSGENYLTVRYEKIVPLLIEAIKELQSEIKNLKGE